MNLTADQITVDGDTAYVVAEGTYTNLFFADRNLYPQPWMTATCKTCVIPPEMMGAFVVMDQSACPDCLNGKPIHTFDVKCKDGTVSYRLAVREVLPGDAGTFTAVCDVVP